MSTHTSNFHLRPRDWYPGANGWLQPSSVEIGAHLDRLRATPESEIGALAARWLAEHAWHCWYGRNEGLWMQTLLSVDEPLTKAIEWSINNDPIGALALTGAISRYWFLRNGYDVGAPLLQRALKSSLELTPERARAMSGLVLAGLSLCAKMPPGNVMMAEEALEAFRELKDRWGEARAMWHLGLAHCYAGKSAQAIDCYWKALEVFRELEDPIGQANVLLCIASLPWHSPETWGSQIRTTLPLLVECLSLFRSIGNDWSSGVALTVLMSDKEFLTAEQSAIVQDELKLRAGRRRAEWDLEGAKETERLAGELASWTTVRIAPHVDSDNIERLDRGMTSWVL